MNYQMWLTDEQKALVLKYIADRRYGYMAGMLTALAVSLFIIIAFLPMLLWEVSGIEHDWTVYAEPFTYFLMFFSIFAGMFLKGIGKIFGKNSDYDCLRHDKYSMDFREFWDRLPNKGKYPYYVSDALGNAYQCPIFLDYRNAKQGSTFLCIHLSNGKKYALLEKVNMKKAGGIS